MVGGTGLFRLAQRADANKVHASLATQHIWCRRFEWADDLLRFGLPSHNRDLDRLAGALASTALNLLRPEPNVLRPN
jgi:cobalamin biosynthetic protein CobC